jgi:hypothetical protein
MISKQPATVADVEGPWRDPRIESGLTERCRRGWNTPIAELTNALLATFIRQRIALTLVVPEARKRLDAKWVDGSDLHDQELENALKSVTGEA